MTVKSFVFALFLIFISIYCSSCAYITQSYKSYKETALSEPFPLTPKAFDVTIHPRKLFKDEKSAIEKIDSAFIYPIMIPFSFVYDAWVVIGYPIAPLTYWMYKFTA